jgi:hypothetical protein
MVYNSPDDYLYHLEACTSSQAKKLWKNSIKDEWNRKCAYCKSEEDLTLDHVIPQCKGGRDVKTNLVCACKKCNLSKAHTPWMEWYSSQDFFTTDRMTDIIEWMAQDVPKENVVYYPFKMK